MVKEEPLFVEAFFRITSQQIFQKLYFYYYDPSKIFLNLKSTGAISGELESIKDNLQEFIDEDDLFVNKKKTRMVIQNASLDFQMRNPFYPYIIFNIASEPIKLSKTELNLIHLYAKPEELSYPAISCWETIGIIDSVISDSLNIISQDGKRVMFYMAKGELIGGHERINIIFPLND